MTSKWRVIYYRAPNGTIPVKDFLDAARPQQKAKAFRILFNIQEYGLQTAISHIKKLQGTPLWEMRILGSEGIRIVYVTQTEQRVILLHGFYKKTQKTPKREIMIALERYRELT